MMGMGGGGGAPAGGNFLDEMSGIGMMGSGGMAN